MAAFGTVKTSQPLTSVDTLDFGFSGAIYTNDAVVGTNRTYNPMGYNANQVARWVDRSSGIQVGYPHFEISHRPPVNGSKVNRVVLTVALPTLEQTSASTASGIQPAPTKAYDTAFKGEFMLPERGSRWERLALLNTLISLLMASIKASDGTPDDTTGSPLRGVVLDFDMPY